MNGEYLLIIDGSSLLSTQFFGNLPREVLMAKNVEEKEKYYYKIMKTSKGVYTNGVYGFLRTLFSIIEKQKPTYLAVTWDITRDTFRRELYPDYKANRSETIEPLKQQFILCQEILARMGVAQFMDSKYEADDYSGSIAKKFGKEVPVAIMTKDHDYLQLVDDNVKLWLLLSDQSKADAFYNRHDVEKGKHNTPEKTVWLDRELVNKEFGVYPESIPSLKGLMGDSADNIKGVPGIGDKTATSLIAYYKNVEGLYSEINNSYDPKELALKWKTELGISRNPYNYLTKESDTELVGEKAARLSEKLATIICDLPIEKNLEDLKTELDTNETNRVLKELEINSLNPPKSGGESEKDVFEKEFSENLLVISDLMTYFEKKEVFSNGFTSGKIGISIETDAGLVTGVGISDGIKTLVLRAEGFLTSDAITESLNEIMTECSYIVCFDYKKHIDFVPNIEDFFDCAVADYLLNPLSTTHGYKNVLDTFDVTLCNDYDELGLSAYVSIKFHDELENLLKEKEMYSLYEEVEKPLIKVLHSMEKVGIRCSVEELTTQGQELKQALTKCENDIYDLAGEKFNILSPKQLGDILFGKLGLKGGKKNKSGYSTAADVLEKLAPEHKIVRDVLYYRQLSKLISTYVDGLSSSIRNDGRIHCTFNQMVTATGRLSCTEPNLQNIPVRDELGRRIRKAFIPEEGCVFVDADYSQIELRVMAHMAGDERLLDDYRNSRDIHRSTAANVFNVPYDEVTSKQRRDAKAVNFGIIYGISSFGLGQDLDISRAQAAEYIQTYFREYPQIKVYLDGLVETAKSEESVKTLFGRIRPIPEIKSSNFMQRSFGERIAMNSPIQGTAADIMKIAMIKVYNELNRRQLRAKMVLQIHDEILIEAPEDEKEVVKEILIEQMTSAVKLKVDLEVDSGCAGNWYDLK